jgi:hypothetical protein
VYIFRSFAGVIDYFAEPIPRAPPPFHTVPVSTPRRSPLRRSSSTPSLIALQPLIASLKQNILRRGL